MKFYIMALKSEETAGKGRKLRFWAENGLMLVYIVALLAYIVALKGLVA